MSNQNQIAECGMRIADWESPDNPQSGYLREAEVIINLQSPSPV